MSKVAKRVVKILAIDVLVTAFFAVCYQSVPFVAFDFSPEGAASVSSTRAPAKGSPAEIASRHNCWGDDGETHPIPSHVVYRREGDWAYGGRKVTMLAFDQLPAEYGGTETDHGIIIFQFCK
jgi:hypothetical protein